MEHEERLIQALADRYQIEREIGSGGMATVYLAQDLRHERQVAVKVFNPELAATLGAERFLREIKTAANLTHPHILPLFDSGEAGGFLFYVMPYVGGESLRSRISREQQLPIGESIRIAREIADALGFAHENNVIHRDIKPENILLEAKHAVVTDFGVARAITAAGEPRLTDTGLAVGTPDYMAPEQAEGGEADGRSDIYALGITLYEMLTGRVPFEGDTPLNVAVKHMTEEPADPRELNDRISEDLSGVVLKCLEKGKEERFQTAEELLSELSNIEQGLPLTTAVRKPELPAFLVETEEQEVGEERPVFVARGEELSKLDEFLEVALTGRGRIVFVKGEAGSGKTALLQEFARLSQEAHADLLVAGGNCNAHTGISDPYLPFREVMALLTGDVEGRWRAGSINRDHARRLWECLPAVAQSLVVSAPDLIDTFMAGRELLDRSKACAERGSGWLRNLRQLVERKAATPPDPMMQQSVLLEQYARVLEALANQKPVLLLLDDLQWADLGSTTLLAHLANRLQRSPVLIAGAYRPEEVSLDRAGERHPLKAITNDCRARFGDVEVEVGRSGNQEFVEAYLDTVPNEFSTTFRESFLKHTEGHSLFTAEVFRALKDQGVLEQDSEGRWMDGEIDWGKLPTRVEATIGERINRMPADLREILRVASIEGEYFTGEVVAGVQDANEKEVVRLLSGELDKGHQLVKAQGFRRIDGQRLSQYRFRHILFQKYLYNTLDEVERAHLHEDVGRVLERLHGHHSGEIAVQLARHFEASGITAKAVAYLQLAGERSVRVSANEEAVAHFRRALELVQGLPATRERVGRELAFQTHMAMALMNVRGYAHPEVGEAFQRAHELCEQVGETPEIVRVLHGLWAFYLVRAEFDTALGFAERILRLAPLAEDPNLASMIGHQQALQWILTGEFDRALGHIAQATALYDQKAHGSSMFLVGYDLWCSFTSWEGFDLWFLGYPDRGRQKIQDALTFARKLGHPHTVSFVLFHAANFYRLCRDVGAVQEIADENYALCSEHGFIQWGPVMQLYQGWVLAERGNANQGITRIRDGLALSQITGAEIYRHFFMTSLVEAYLRAGRIEDGLAVLDECFSFCEKTGERFYESELHHLKGKLLQSQGRSESEVAQHYQKAIEIAREQEARSWELAATVSLCRLMQKQEKTEDARRMLTEIYGWFTEGFDTANLKEAQALLAELEEAQAGPDAEGD